MDLNDNLWNGFNNATPLIFKKKFSTLDASRLELKHECKEMSLLPVLCHELPHAVLIFPLSKLPHTTLVVLQYGTST